jgi:hypothetical protein
VEGARGRREKAKDWAMRNKKSEIRNHCCPVKDSAKALKHARTKAIRIEMDFYDLNS